MKTLNSNEIQQVSGGNIYSSIAYGLIGAGVVTAAQNQLDKTYTVTAAAVADGFMFAYGSGAALFSMPWIVSGLAGVVIGGGMAHLAYTYMSPDNTPAQA